MRGAVRSLTPTYSLPSSQRQEVSFASIRSGKFEGVISSAVQCNAGVWRVERLVKVGATNGGKKGAGNGGWAGGWAAVRWFLVIVGIPIVGLVGEKE